jgi:hypothetical protein
MTTIGILTALHPSIPLFPQKQEHVDDVDGVANFNAMVKRMNAIKNNNET